MTTKISGVKKRIDEKCQLELYKLLKGSNVKDPTDTYISKTRGVTVNGKIFKSWSHY